ncbi:MAG: HEAT repeat domain-containing protein [Anaerolineae bacterium]|nr:HEAT repeat domain-containing protein [Anaerolineae bacterium]
MAFWGRPPSKSDLRFREIVRILKSHPDPGQREEAAVQLQFQGQRALEPLIEALRTDPSADVREAAAAHLGKVGKGSSAAVDALIEALRYGPEEVPGWAAHALGEIGDLRAFQPLVEALRLEAEDFAENAVDSRENWFRRFRRIHAASALGKLGDPRAVPYLVEALQNDPFGFVLDKYYIDALKMIGTPEAVEVIRRFGA